MSIFVIKKVR